MTIILKQVENRHFIPNLFSKYDNKLSNWKFVLIVTDYSLKLLDAT